MSSEVSYTIMSYCPKCGSRLSLRRSRSGDEPFIGCTGYPTCRFSDKYDAAISDLAEQITALHARIAKAETVGLTCDQIRELIFEFHPDRNPRGLDANAVVARLNSMRTRAKQ